MNGCQSIGARVTYFSMAICHGFRYYPCIVANVPTIENKGDL
jgi:hypothetical protein